MKAVILQWLMGIAWITMSGPINAQETSEAKLQGDEFYRLMQAVEHEMASINTRIHTLEKERETLTDKVETLQQQLDQQHEQDNLQAQQ